VHAAKGLEFPVVFVPECASPSFTAGAERVLLAPAAAGGSGATLEPQTPPAAAGLIVKARGADGKRRWGTQGAALGARKRSRDLAQMRRLFYVAVTRARDFLVLSGRAAKKEESWRLWIDQVAPEAVEGGLLKLVRDPGAAPAVAPAGPPVAPGAPGGAGGGRGRTVEAGPRSRRGTGVCAGGAAGRSGGAGGARARGARGGGSTCGGGIVRRDQHHRAGHLSGRRGRAP